MFSKNTSNGRIKEVLEELSISEEAKTKKFLCLLVYVGRSQTKTFKYIKDRVWKRIQGWKERMISKAGKDILIKACAQAIRTFAMSCFDLTKSLCEQMRTAQQDKENKMHWLSWEVLRRPKKGGTRVQGSLWLQSSNACQTGMAHTYNHSLTMCEIPQSFVFPKHLNYGSATDIWYVIFMAKYYEGY
jgi:hypothetical protein